MEFLGRALKFVLSMCAFIMFLTGALALIGYVLDQPALYTLNTDIGINPFTAMCFVMVSSWLLLLIVSPKWAHWFRFPVATVAGTVGLLKLLIVMGVIDSSQNDLVLPALLNTQEAFCRIAPNSAILLLFCSVVIVTYKGSGWWLYFVMDVLKICGFLTAYLAIIGYVYNIEAGIDTRSEIPMALNTAVGYIAFFSYAFFGFHRGPILSVFDSSYVGGLLARRAVPFVLLIPLVFGYLRLMGEIMGVFDTAYGTALQSAAMVLVMLIFVYLLSRRLNKQDEFRHHAEARVAESEQRYRKLINTLREGVIYYDTNGIVLFCNPGFASLTGYRVGEIIGNSIFDMFIRPEAAERYRQRLKDRDAGLSEVYEDSIRTRSGELIWVSISASPVTDEKGEPKGGLSTLVDVTERRKHLEDIEAFSASAAHDLNAPLARIEMIAMLLVETTDNQLDEENMALLKAISGITYNMRGMLKDLLDFSRLGITQIKKDDVPLAEMAAEVVAECASMSPKAKILIHPLPVVKGDPIMLRQVLVNLIGNALKYSSHKQNPLVEIGSLKIHDQNVIYIKDNGAGFSMDDYGKLFAAFQRLHIEFEGNGLGLPIVKRIIEKHGGKIWAEGVPGEGATFYFSMP